MVGPIDAYPLRDDALSGAALQTVRVGSRALIAVSDGFMVIRRKFAGPPDRPTAAYDALSAEYGQARMPLGCFLFPGDNNVLIDAGFGPYDNGGYGVMVGGRLLDRLAARGVRPADIDVVVLSHLHSDHVGWIGTEQGEPVFPHARVVIGQQDWRYFVEEGPRESAPPEHILAALRKLDAEGRVDLVDSEVEIRPGLTRIAAPGHTPGHSVYIVHDGSERMFLLGDAIYCPQQLTSTDWDSMTDVDPRLARQTRVALVREIEHHQAGALGCHFPGLIAGRLIAPSEAQK